MESRLSWVDKKLKLYVLLKLSIITVGPLSFHRKLKKEFFILCNTADDTYIEHSIDVSKIRSLSVGVE